MNNSNPAIQRICMVGIFSALYAVFSALVKVPLIGHTYLDTGYIVLTVAAALMPPLDTALVGVVGCGVVDILTNPYQVRRNTPAFRHGDIRRGVHLPNFRDTFYCFENVKAIML